MLLGLLFCRTPFCFQVFYFFFGFVFVAVILFTNFKPSLADLSAHAPPIDPYLMWRDTTASDPQTDIELSNTHFTIIVPFTWNQGNMSLFSFIARGNSFFCLFALQRIYSSVIPRSDRDGVRWATFFDICNFLFSFSCAPC